MPRTALAIVVPQDGDIFKLDPVLRRSYQSLTLQVHLAAETGVRTIEWWIDGRKVAEVGPPFRFSWNLAPGSYTIKARGLAAGGSIESPPVRIQVLS
jgi:membrane carboxypeptidase/penicillin-binding protein PbpC